MTPQPMTKGETVVYVSLSGHRHAAQVVGVREDGTVDLAVDAGGGDHVQLTKIERRGKDGEARGRCQEL